MEINKTNLISSMYTAYKSDIPWFAVHIHNAKEKGDEVILFSHDNFLHKKNYYMKNYTEDLKLRHCMDISIVGFVGGTKEAIFSSLEGGMYNGEIGSSK